MRVWLTVAASTVQHCTDLDPGCAHNGCSPGRHPQRSRQL